MRHNQMGALIIYLLLTILQKLEEITKHFYLIPVCLSCKFVWVKPHHLHSFILTLAIFLLDIKILPCWSSECTTNNILVVQNLCQTLGSSHSKICRWKNCTGWGLVGAEQLLYVMGGQWLAHVNSFELIKNCAENCLENAAFRTTWKLLLSTAFMVIFGLQF